MTSTPVTPFALPIPPPPPLVVLLDLTDLHNLPPPSLLALEDLDKGGARPVRGQSLTHRYSPYPPNRADVVAGKQRALQSAVSTPRSSPSRSVSPNIEVPPTTTLRRAPIPNHASSSGAGTSQAVILTIARPKNASRVNLESLLKWNSDVYKDFRMAVTVGCKAHLELTKSYLSQDEKKLNKLREEIIGDYQMLKQYDGAWPLEVAIVAALKSSAAASKKKAS